MGLAITAEAANSDFVIKTDEEGDKYVAGYKGKGGNITIPSDVIYVGAEAFMGYKTITDVTFPKNCYFVDESAFSFCTNLKKVVFEGDATISSYAFELCIDLESVTVKGSFDYCIYNSAFWGCQNLKTVKAQKNEKEFFIGKNAFRDCFSLKSINIPSKCTEIQSAAFLNCFSLEKLTIPAKTKINTDKDANYHFGYAMMYKRKDDHELALYGGSANPEFFVANGKNSGYYDQYMHAGDINKNKSDDYFEFFDEDLYAGVKKYTPKAITLTVTKGSSAEKWAKANKVKYTYAGSSSSSSSAPSNLKASAASNSVTLTWDKADGAAMYRVYKYNSTTKKYDKYKDITSTKCTVSGLKANTKYTFKVTAYSKSNGKYVKGESSKAVSVTTKK